MAKLIFYFNIILFIRLFTLYQINGIPIRMVSKIGINNITPMIMNMDKMEWVKENAAILSQTQSWDTQSESTILPNGKLVYKESEHPRVVGRTNNTNLKKLLLDKNLLRNYDIAKALRKYDPDKKKETVCYDKSTIYNKPVVIKYLKTEIKTNPRFWDSDGTIDAERRYFFQLREQMFDVARSEECHTRKYDKIRPYLECALRRSQRMEYLVPQYPLHQLYWTNLTTILSNNIYN